MSHRKKFLSSNTATVEADLAMESMMPEPVEDTVDYVGEEIAEVTTQVAEVVETPVHRSSVQVEVKPESVRTSVVKTKLEEFVELYKVGKPLTDAERKAMVRSIEQMFNTLLSADTFQEVAAIATAIRLAFFDNPGKVFTPARTLGQMRDPRSGALVVQHERTVSLTALFYTTADPTTFNAQKGRIDISAALIGCPENSAALLRQYFGQ